MYQQTTPAVALPPSPPALDSVTASSWLRSIAERLTAPQAAPSPLEVPSELKGRQLTHRQLEKFQGFEDFVVRPLAMRLREMDPDSAVRIGGSYKNNPDGVRLWSDMDVIILSRTLRSPEKYVEVLATLHGLARDYQSGCEGRETSCHPVFFTRAATENFFQHMAAQVVLESRQKEASQPTPCLEPDYRDFARVLPCHVLCYSDAQEFLDREPEYLGGRLLRSSKGILESPGDLFFAQKRSQNMTVLQATLWDVERCTAELVLNQGFLKPGMLALHYANAFHQSIRFLADHIPAKEDLSVEKVLRYLDRDRSSRLWNSFAPVLSVRQSGPHHPLDALLVSAMGVIGACRDIMSSDQAA